MHVRHIHLATFLFPPFPPFSRMFRNTNSDCGRGRNVFIDIIYFDAFNTTFLYPPFSFFPPVSRVSTLLW